jgi:hypothetical protein
MPTCDYDRYSNPATGTFKGTFLNFARLDCQPVMAAAYALFIDYMRFLFESWRWDSNPRPADYKSAALPTELRQQFLAFRGAILAIDRQ